MTNQSHHHHRLSTCHRHPTTKPITGFCAQCLRERLAGMDPSSTTPTAAELRRTKSYSSSSNPADADTNNSLYEPRRKSCDVVRPRNRHTTTTLSDLFNLADDQKRKPQNPKPKPQISQLEPELKEEEEEEEENQEEIRACGGGNNNSIDFEEEGEIKTMKEFIDLEWESKKNNNTNRFSFWETASHFSKRLRKWQRNKDKKQVITNADNSAVEIIHEKPNVGRLRETQSEVGEYGVFGRRSCDTDPRLSADAGRYSFDDVPRSSLDGYLNEKFSYLPRFTPMISVIEDLKNVELKDREEEKSPGGSAQTRDYYGETLNPQRRRKSFDSRRVGLGDVDEANSAVLNAAKVSPETVGLFHGAKLLVTEKELRDSNWYSAKDESAASKDNVDLVAATTAVGVGQKGVFSSKRSQRKWSNVWNIWGLIARRQSENKCGDEEDEGKCVGENVIDGGGLADSWQNLRRVANGYAGEGVSVSQKLIRSYSVSARNSFKMDALVLGKNDDEANTDDMMRKEELLLQRNSSARYSPNNLDSGLLRFYLTPSRTYKRSKSGMSRLKNVHSVAGNIL